MAGAGAGAAASGQRGAAYRGRAAGAFQNVRYAEIQDAPVPTGSPRWPIRGWWTTCASGILPSTLDAGLFVTVNSDDPPMFGTSLSNEYLVAATVLGLSAADLAGLADNAVRASFLDEGTKDALCGEIAEVLAGHGAGRGAWRGAGRGAGDRAALGSGRRAGDGAG